MFLMGYIFTDIDEKFHDVIDHPTKPYVLIELRDLVRHLDRYWLSVSFIT